MQIFIHFPIFPTVEKKNRKKDCCFILIEINLLKTYFINYMITEIEILKKEKKNLKELMKKK